MISIEEMKEFIAMYDGLKFLDKYGINVNEDYLMETRVMMLEEIIKHYKNIVKEWEDADL